MEDEEEQFEFEDDNDELMDPLKSEQNSPCSSPSETEFCIIPDNQQENSFKEEEQVEDVDYIEVTDDDDSDVSPQSNTCQNANKSTKTTTSTRRYIHKW